MKLIIGLLAIMVSMAFSLMSAYHVEPVKAQWSGWVPGDENHGVAQTITCNFDSLVYGGFWHHALDFPQISTVIL